MHVSGDVFRTVLCAQDSRKRGCAARLDAVHSGHVHWVDQLVDTDEAISDQITLSLALL